MPFTMIRVDLFNEQVAQMIYNTTNFMKIIKNVSTVKRFKDGSLTNYRKNKTKTLAFSEKIIYILGNEYLFMKKESIGYV